MLIGTPLNKAELKDHYDAIIIGSGISGLTVASILAQHKQKVLVLEQHHTAGGFTHTFRRRGFEWDVGLHYLGNLQKDSPFRKMFDYISEKQIKWNLLEDNYDTIIINNKHYKYIKGKENLKQELKKNFPQEEQAVNKYFQLLELAQTTRKDNFLAKILPKFLNKHLTKDAKYFNNLNTYETLKKLTKNETLIAVLTGQWGDYGLPPKKSNLAIHSMVTSHYFEGAYYPVGGASQIARQITKTIEKHGGQVVTRAQVYRILVSNNKAFGIQLENKKIKAKRVISTVGLHNTNKLIRTPIPNTETLEASPAHLCLYIGLNKSKEELNLKQSNLWIYDNENFDELYEKAQKDITQPFPVTYISFPSTKDPQWDIQYPNKSTIEIIVPINYQFFKKWEDSEWKHRPEDYEALKEQLSQRLLETLYKHHPQTKDNITHYELSTPLSTKYFSKYNQGEIYGLQHSSKRLNNQNLKPQTHIKNLYLSGQDILTAGVAGALFAGTLTAVKILGFWKSRKIFGKIKP